MSELTQRARKWAALPAIEEAGIIYTYTDLWTAAMRVASGLLNGRLDLEGDRVAYMVEPGFGYVAAQWGIWMAGGVAVPIALSYPLPSIAYILEDTDAAILLADDSHFSMVQPLTASFKFQLRNLANLMKAAESSLPTVDPESPAMILYTSGTTSKPKGVVTTHGGLEAQISTLVHAWKWTQADYTVCVLPLHHVHGIVNVVSCALWSGATVAFLPRFSPEALFDLFLKGRINVFMAVPTIYFKLIQAFEAKSLSEQQLLTQCMHSFRLMVSGSAALPVSTLEKWRVISGHTLLERYGMTEIGMGISNPYAGERRAGYIGQPLPGVGIRLVNENQVIQSEGIAGEIQVKGANVFKQYWNKPEATQAAFTPDGWFRTGDIAVVEKGYYRILGRESVDIIKSGGYKISALEIEEILRTYPSVADCCVVGIPDAEWGEVVAVAVVGTEATWEEDALKNWLKTQLPTYKVPKNYLLVKELPRNAMGKVTKNEVKQLFV